MAQVVPHENGRPRILLVEGVPGIGKSTMLDRMLRTYVAGETEGQLRTVVSLAQTHTYGPLAVSEDLGTLTKEASLEHLNGIVGWLEWIADNSKRQPRPKSFLLLDTLHLTHCLRPGVLDWRDVVPVDRRLAAIGCKLLLLDAENDTIRERTVEARADTEFVREYALGRFGQNDAELVDYFQRERDLFREMCSESSMEKMRLMAEEPLEETAALASRFWSSPGA